MVDQPEASGVEMTLTALLAAVSGATRNEDEAFDLLDSILAEGWITILPEKDGVAEARASARRFSPPTVKIDRHRLGSRGSIR